MGSHEKTGHAVQRVNTSSVAGPCTSTATRRSPRVNLNMVVQECAIMSSPSQGKDIHVPQIIATKIVLGVLLAITSVLKTSSQVLTRRKAVDAQARRTKTTAPASRETASTSLLVTPMQSASSRKRSAATCLTSNVSVALATLEMEFSAWTLMEL